MQFTLSICKLLFILQLLTILVQVIGSSTWNSEQIHLSLGSNSSSEIIVTWVTLEETNETASVSFYEANESDNVSIAYGTSDKFVDDGPAKKVRFVHRVALSNLKPSSEYFYQVIGRSNWYTFKTLTEGSKENKFLIFGDWGYEGEHLMTSMMNEVQLNEISAAINLGDIAYDLHDKNGDVGDLFMNMIEPFASKIVHQVVPGNHEKFYNFSHYDARFTMIDQTSGVKNNHFYSFNIGLVHFVVYSTEYIRYTEYGTVQIENQYNWIVKDLTKASLPENRSKRPWIIVLGHTPWYTDDIWCMQDALRLRSSNFSLEKVFYESKVDLVISGHVHKYQRTWPIYDGKVCNGSANEPYTDANAPVHLISGSGGCWYGLSPKTGLKYFDGLAFTNYDYSYTFMSVFNETHLKFEQKLADKSNFILDEFYVIKNLNKPYKKCN